MIKQYLKDGDIAYTTGACVEWDAKEGFWFVTAFEEDTFYNGKCVEDIENKPYVEEVS